MNIKLDLYFGFFHFITYYIRLVQYCNKILMAKTPIVKLECYGYDI